MEWCAAGLDDPPSHLHDTGGLVSPLDAAVLRLLVNFPGRVLFCPYRVSLSWLLLSMLSGTFFHVSHFVRYHDKIPDETRQECKAYFGSRFQRTVHPCGGRHGDRDVRQLSTSHPLSGTRE